MFSSETLAVMAILWILPRALLCLCQEYLLLSIRPEKERIRTLTEAVQKLLEEDAIEPVLDHCSPRFYSHLFLVPKRDGRQRPVIGLSHLNSFLETEHFKRETPATIMAAMRQNDWTNLTYWS